MTQGGLADTLHHLPGLIVGKGIEDYNTDLSWGQWLFGAF